MIFLFFMKCFFKEINWTFLSIKYFTWLMSIKQIWIFPEILFIKYIFINLFILSFQMFSNISEHLIFMKLFPRILEKHQMFNYFNSRIFKFLNQSNQEPGTRILEKHKMFKYFNSRTFKFFNQSNQEPGTWILEKHKMLKYFNSWIFKFLNQFSMSSNFLQHFRTFTLPTQVNRI